MRRSRAERLPRGESRRSVGQVSGACLLAMAFLMVCLPATGTAMEISFAAALDVPLWPDSNLLGLGAGGNVALHQKLNFCRLFSAGVQLGYRLVPMHNADLGELGSLSLLAASASVQARLWVAHSVVLLPAASFGYFYAVETRDISSWATNLLACADIGVGYELSEGVGVGITISYRNYLRLYHAIGVEAWAELAL